ncbi:MAG: ATP-NAD kinase family protein [Alphaproteobacteria bacterium]
MTGATIGIIVNPIAGLGGTVGLKGTDGADVVRRALALGAEPRSETRMTEALVELVRQVPSLRAVAGAGAMGQAAAHAAGLAVAVIGSGHRGPTGPEDTVAVARALRDRAVALVLFAGGDGTARDVLRAIGDDGPVLGVPAGVKMHSGVFAASPRAAAALAAAFLEGRAALAEIEVMDLDEDAYRAGRLSARLFGYLRVPFTRGLIQGVKVGGVAGDAAALAGAAAEVARRLPGDALVVLGPGTTVRAVAEVLGVAKTLLGVDLVCGGRVIGLDVAEADILRALDDAPDVRVVVAPIGGQGHILGRGNQQIGPAVLRRVGPDHLIVVATPAKLASLYDATLRVDTGDAALDRAFAGFRRVVTGLGGEAVCHVAA